MEAWKQHVAEAESVPQPPIQKFRLDDASLMRGRNAVAEDGVVTRMSVGGQYDRKPEGHRQSAEGWQGTIRFNYDGTPELPHHPRGYRLVRWED